MKTVDATTEVQVIRALLDAPNRGALLGQVEEDYFGYAPAQEIYRRVITIMNVGKEIPSSEVFRNDQTLSEEARSLLNQPNSLDAGNIKAAIENLVQHRKARILSAAMAHTMEVMSGTNVDVDLVVSNVENMLQSCHTTNDSTEMVHYTKADADKIVEKIGAELADTNDDDLLKTGLKVFDDRSGGLHRKNVLVMASVPGGGKSALALNMATAQYELGYNVCFVSYEMDEIELRYRMLSTQSRIEHSKINLKRLTSKHIDLIKSRFKDFLSQTPSDNRLTIWTPSRELTIPQIALELKPMNYDVIYIDYISLLKPTDPKKAMWEILGDHSRHAKLAANNLNAAVVLLAQYDDEGNKLKYSKAIQANANFVWVWDHGEKEREAGLINIRHLKARNAPVYNFYLEKDFTTFTFKDYFGPSPLEDEEEEKPRKSRKKVPSMPELRS